MKIRDLSEKGVLFVAQIRRKGGCFLTLEHEYVPFLGPRGGAGHGIQGKVDGNPPWHMYTGKK